MAQGQITKSFKVNLLSLIPSLVSVAEALFGGGSGAEKKAAVQQTLGSIFAIGASAAAENNPAYAPQIGNLIDGIAAVLFPHPAPPADVPPATGTNEA